MEFTEEWKSGPEIPFGPLLFTPNPDVPTTLLLSSPALAPRLPPAYPNLSISRFFQNYNCIPAPAAATELPDYSSQFHGFNSLQLLQIPNKNLVVAFFPTGDNSDSVGFSLLFVKDGVLSGHSRRENFFQVVGQGNLSRLRITRLSISPVDDYVCGVDRRGKNVDVVGLLMVCTDYSVSWYRVGLSTLCKQDEYSVCLDYLGCADARMLKGSAVVSACWSPHSREECLVLLENGYLLLFEVDNSCGKKVKGLSFIGGRNRVVSRKMQVSLNDELGLDKANDDKARQWLGCEFSWHHRILFASNCNEVFLVDLRSSGKCNIRSLLKLEMLHTRKSDRFCAFSRAGTEGFTFIVSTRYLLLLCDVREPPMPVLRWEHKLRNPRYVRVYKLSELRGNAKDTKYELASESGYCIMLGSFWDSEFSLFCYGPHGDGNESVSPENSKSCNSYHKWGPHSELSFSHSDCNCGSCILREEYLKASIPIWIDWRQKMHLILGFGILEPHLSVQLSSPDDFGGFTLIRLSSAGKIEAVSYRAVWEFNFLSEVGHKRKRTRSEDNLLYDCSYTEYDLEKKFQHLKFEFLRAYLKDKMAKCIVRKRAERKESDEDGQRNYPVESESIFHRELCRKMKDFGFPSDRSAVAVSDVLKDVSLPTSINEIALKSMCAALPSSFLQLAFSMYSDFDKDSEKDKEPLEFLNIPEQLQVPPFPFRNPSYRSNKWSTKVQPSSTLVGPVVPTHFLTTLHRVCVEELKDERELYQEESEEFSAHSQLKLQCAKVMEVVAEHASGSDTKAHDDDFVSLADDTEDMSSQNKTMKFSYHKPLAFLENSSMAGMSKPGCENDIFSTHVFRRRHEIASDLSAEMVGHELFDIGCPIELKFDDSTISFGPKELELYQSLKKRDLDFQKRFKPYQDYISRVWS